MTEQNTELPLDENQQITVRKEKLVTLRNQGNAYPNDFIRKDLAANIHALHDQANHDELELKNVVVTVAGRVMTRRIMGKASFVTIQDMTGRIQLYVTKDAIDPIFYEEEFKKWDIGDIVGAQGILFKTKTGELSIRVAQIRLLTKALRPLPDKWHGLADIEARYRQRYVDLIMNESTRSIFTIRFKALAAIRQFFTDRHFIEVETPMLQVLAGGAAARPFETHHHALDIPMYLRIAPELFLKRLVVGGIEKVYEINRNFRNEGVSTRHNPEFTMLECYEAYADYQDAMKLCEDLIRHTCQHTLGATVVNYQGQVFDFSKPFNRMTMLEAIQQFNPDIKLEALQSLATITPLMQKMGLKIDKSVGLGKLQTEIFEETVEHCLIEPTFITAYPAEVSPLARRNDQDPFITDRFELFIGGRELANGFSELNDPELQAEVFAQQMHAKAAGDDEAMPYDADYITALEYGLPPTAGLGVGIDRLVMLLTDSPSIRDIILFPHMRQVHS
jgi:lysyl-tRNA synthetase class 2